MTGREGGGATCPPDAGASDDAELAVDSGSSDVTTAPDIAVATARHLIPGPSEEGWEPALAEKALGHDRCWQVFNGTLLGMNLSGVVIADEADRGLVDEFIHNGSGWEAEFEAFAGKPSTDLMTYPEKVAGLYGGVGIAADAYRYGVLRDQGYGEAEVEQARAQLLKALAALHVMVDITGVEGVIARGVALLAWNERWNKEITPLFAEDGSPLPEEKSNGTWRADNSAEGSYPDLMWEDSVSRDQLVGWVAAYGAAWEVIGDDDTIPQEVKDTLRADARALGRALMVVRESGHDLEVPDADGRVTLHGWLNEENLDGQVYIDGFENGFHAVMALGIVAAYVYASGDEEMRTWLEEDLIGERELPRIVKEAVYELVDFGYGSNFSNYNMAFMGFWLAVRYLEDPAAREIVREGLATSMYDRPGRDFQPADIHYSFFDFTYAAAEANANAVGIDALAPPPSEALESGLDTLRKFAPAPYWEVEVVNCPILETFECADQYRETGQCTWDPVVLEDGCVAIDGETVLEPIGCSGWKCTTVVAEALPWELQRPTNYHWRSPPHDPNGNGDGTNLLPGVDFRFAYWLGRWTEVGD